MAAFIDHREEEKRFGVFTEQPVGMGGCGRALLWIPYGEAGCEWATEYEARMFAQHCARLFEFYSVLSVEREAREGRTQ